MYPISDAVCSVGRVSVWRCGGVGHARRIWLAFGDRSVWYLVISPFQEGGKRRVRERCPWSLSFVNSVSRK